MLGRDFSPGVVYADGDRWLKVRTRGPVITRGVPKSIVRLTAEDEEGTLTRGRVYAMEDYPTAAAFPVVSV